MIVIIVIFIVLVLIVIFAFVIRVVPAAAAAARGIFLVLLFIVVDVVLLVIIGGAADVVVVPAFKKSLSLSRRPQHSMSSMSILNLETCLLHLMLCLVRPAPRLVWFFSSGYHVSLLERIAYN